MREKQIHRRAEKGQSLIEFAFSLVVLLILLAGAVDGGRALFTYLSMRDAAQEGALYASINPTDNSGIINRARNSSNMIADIGGSINITVTPTVTGKYCAGMTAGNAHGMTVRLEYANFPLTMPFIGAAIGSTTNTIPISAEVNNMIIIPKCSP